MIKMVVTDLDDTLLRSDKTVSELSASVFKKLRAAGIKTVFATGRGDSAERIVPPGMFDGRVTQNGAVASADGRRVGFFPVPCEDAKPMLLKAESMRMKIAVELGGVHYANFEANDTWRWIGKHVYTDFSDFELDGEKMYMMTEYDGVRSFLANYTPGNLYYIVGRDGLAQIMHKSATKLGGIKVLCDFWDIPLCDTAAFGDDVNDLDMLKGCGAGVAMGNALCEVKAVADEVCGTNEDDGMARWLMNNINGIA